MKQFTVIITAERDEAAVARSSSNRSKPCFVKGKYWPSAAAAARAMKISNPKSRPDFRFVSKEEYAEHSK